MRTILIFVLLLSAFSCCPRLMPVMTTTGDSVRVVEHVRELWRDTTVYVALPLEKQNVVAPADSSFLETSVASSAAWIDGAGLLHHLLENKPTSLPATIKVRDVQTDRNSRTTQTYSEIRAVEVSRAPSWWERLWIVSGRLAWGLAGAALVVFIVRLRGRR